MSEATEPTISEVFLQLTEILQKALARISEVEQHITKDLESIRQQLDAVGVLKENIANLNSRIDLLSKKLAEISKQEPQELSRLLLRTISELDKRMQMFTITEVLSRMEGTTLGASPTSMGAIIEPAPKTKGSSKSTGEAKHQVTAESATEEKSEPDAVAESTGTDKPWREQMRRKYGLKDKPGSL
ncbi:MAG: hypothetical protein ACFFDP_06980 [Promethearchaeota archaeon]